MAFGYPGVRGEESPIAGFPASGLVALYKCDERSGDKLYDATGNLTPIQLYTGVALDCTANLCNVTDTAFAGVLNGLSADVIVGFEIVTPALVSTGTEHRLLSGNTSTNGPVNCWLTEASTFASTNRFSISFRMTMSGSLDYNIALAAADFLGFPPSTAVQIVARINATSGTPHLEFAWRESSSTEWQYCLKNNGAGSGAYTLVSSVTNYNVLVRGTTTTPFKGKVRLAFVSQGTRTLDWAKDIFGLHLKSEVQIALGTNARYWIFDRGTGTVCDELIADTTPTITTTGTVTWGNALAGITQTATRQGLGEDGPAGVRIGGESGHAPGAGYGASAENTKRILTSPNGWTMLATLRTGSRIPATDQFLFSVYGPQLDGSYSTDPTLQPGAHLVLDNAGLLRGVMKRTSVATGAAQSAGEQGIGVGNANIANGLFGTYVISCSSAGAVSLKRIVTGDTSVTTVSTAIGTNVANLATYATRVAIGNASFGADAIVGFCAIYERELTDAEIAQCYRMSLARMRGAELYVLAAAAAGNGTERYPYSDTFPAIRVHQPYQICNWGAGEYTRFDQTASTTASSSNQGITWRGTGGASFLPGAALADYPVFLEDGSWTFSGITFDANDAAYYAMRVDEGVTSIEFSSCTWKDGHMWVDGVDPEGGSTATGSGLVSRAALNLIYNCTATGNDEHGVYLRIVGETAVDQRFVVDGLTVSGGGEDGLKVTNEEAYGARWVNSAVNRVKVTGGKSQLYLLGMKDSVVSNCLLLDQSVNTSLIAPLLLGKPRAYSGETLTGDYPLENVTVANITIVNPTATPYAVLVQGDSASGSVTLRNIITSGCAKEYSDATTAGTVSVDYCAGEDSANPWPSTGSNIPDATIAFTDSGAGDYTLTEASDGYGDGINLTGLSDEAEVMFDGTTRRPSTGAWNMGAY